MLVIVSTTCPDTIARAPARPAARLRTRGKNQLISARYITSQTENPTATRQSIAKSKATDPTREASAKATTLITSAATSVTARAACICFCAMRPAKSSSKKLTFCPNVQRCSRDSTSGFTLGCTMIALEAEERPNSTGRATRKNAIAPKTRTRLLPSKNRSGPALTVASITLPKIHAVPASIAPAAADRKAASQSTGQAPARHQRMKAQRVCGGGPSAGRNGLIQFEMLTSFHPMRENRPTDGARKLHIGQLSAKALHGCPLRRYDLDPEPEFGPSRQSSTACARWR